MKLKEFLQQSKPFVKPFCVSDGEDFRLKEVDPGDTCGLTSGDKPRVTEMLASGSRRWLIYRICSTRRIAGPCCSSSRRWTRLAKTARLST